MPVAENVSNYPCDACGRTKTEIVDCKPIPAQGNEPAKARYTMHCLNPKCGATFSWTTSDKEIIFPLGDSMWSRERKSLLFAAIVDESRRVICVLPYEVAMSDRLDGQEREETTREFFLQHQAQVERVARRLIEAAPEDATEVVIRSLAIS